jgi:hypothetical protein
VSFGALWKQKKQQFDTPDFIPVNVSNSIKSVELEILQVREKLMNRTVMWQTGKSARSVLRVSMIYCVKA